MHGLGVRQAVLQMKRKHMNGDTSQVRDPESLVDSYRWEGFILCAHSSPAEESSCGTGVNVTPVIWVLNPSVHFSPRLMVVAVSHSSPLHTWELSCVYDGSAEGSGDLRNLKNHHAIPPHPPQTFAWSASQHVKGVRSSTLCVVLWGELTGAAETDPRSGEWCRHFITHLSVWREKTQMKAMKLCRALNVSLTWWLILDQCGQRDMWLTASPTVRGLYVHAFVSYYV